MISFETIDLVRLKHLPTYKLPATYHLQQDSGNGCFMDPPGYPTYFTRSVYTQHGNNPPNGPNQVILFEGAYYVTASSKDWVGCAGWDAYDARIIKRMRALYKPLPLDHPRVQAWIQAEFAYFHNCYIDMRKPEAIRKAVAELAVIPNGAPLDFHRATIDIQEIYPEFVPTPEIAAAADRGGNWWETEAIKPTAETCKPRSMGRHPINGTWCQWCGWRKGAA